MAKTKAKEETGEVKATTTPSTPKLYSAGDIRVRISVLNPRDRFVVDTLMSKMVRLNESEMSMSKWETLISKYLSQVNYKFVKK